MTVTTAGSPLGADSGYELVSDPARAREALSLRCGGCLPPLLYETDTPLGEVPLDFPPSARHLWLYAHKPGRPATWIRKRREFLDHRLYILLSDRDPFSFTAARILSSLGVPCGLRQEAEQPDWEAWADLLGYAAYAAVPHAPVEPFASAMRSYRPERARPFCMDALAIIVRQSRKPSGPDADATDISDIRKREMCDAERVDRFFLDRHPCSFCPAWRVCMGTYERVRGEGENTCSVFFREWMEACECPAIEK